MASPKPSSATPPVHHRIRTLFAAMFGFLAVGLIIASVVVVWLNATLTNTGQYVNTVAPLVKSPDIQNFVVDKTTDALLGTQDNSQNQMPNQSDKQDQSSQLHDIAVKLLGKKQVAGKTDEQLRALVTPKVQATLTQIVSSPGFATLWTNANRTLHASLMSQLNSSSETIRLDFAPLINDVLNQLSGTNLAFIKGNLQIDDSSAQVSFRGQQLASFRRYYNYFKDAVWLVVLITLVSIILCVWLSVHHKKTVRRVAMATGIYAAVLWGLLGAGSLVKLGGQNAANQKFIVALFDGITHNLRLSLLVVAVVGIGGALASKLYDVWRARRTK